MPNAITLLFTDVEGSTPLWEAHPDEMRRALERHDALIEQHVVGHGGRLVRPRGEGDSRFAVFEQAADAVAAIFAIQLAMAEERWPTPLPLRIRAAVHTGTAEFRDDDYYGSHVNRCAHLRSLGHGGQTLVSDVSREIIGELPDGVSFRDLGIWRLKGVAEPQRVYQLVHRSLQNTFPPLKGSEGVGHNLPVAVNSFVGREAELLELRKLLSQTRFLTLTGSGGAGKTRLAAQLAHEVLDQFADGVWLVELAPISNGALVVQMVAGALAVREEPSSPLQTTLVTALHDRELLLVLDNCEHLRPACAELVYTILRACPKVRVLATSRQLLGTDGEVAWRVPSLAAPDPRAPLKDEDIQTFPAVQLFVDRLRAVDSGFALTDGNAAAVAQICWQLDGIPLALELAAACGRALSVEQIAPRLANRFRLLTQGHLTALPRQQTLRAAVDWSYDLLESAEQTLLRRLAAFRGSWTLEAAEAVCGPDGQTAVGVLESLAALVDKSLVVVDTAPQRHFSFLETIRQYALEKLEQSGEAERVRAQHLQWCVVMVQAAEVSTATAPGAPWLDELELEHENVRAALEWALGHERLAEALQIASVFWRFWLWRGHAREGRRWMEDVLDSRQQSEPHLTARTLCGAGWLLDFLGEFELAEQRFQEALTLWREADNRPAVANTLGELSWVVADRGDHHRAIALSEESLRIARELDDHHLTAIASLRLGQHLTMLGETERALPLVEQAIDAARELGDQFAVSAGLDTLGLVERLRGNFARASAVLEQSVCLVERLGFMLNAAEAQFRWADVLWRMQHVDRAESLCHQGLLVADKSGDRRRFGTGLRVAASIAAARGDWARAARLGGAAQARFAALGGTLTTVEQADLDEMLNLAAGGLEPATFEGERRAGAALSSPQALGLALLAGSHSSPPRG